MVVPFYLRNETEDWRCGSVVQDLLFKYEVLSSNPNLPEKKLQKMKQK
jgi:hypothetical protein